MNLYAQIAEWYVHKDLCNKTVRSWVRSHLMPLNVTSRCSHCHEGARDLQDVAAYAGDVREVTVLYVLLHLLLGRDGGRTGGDADGGVATAHAALLAIQAAVYARPGGSLQVRRAARRITHSSPHKLLTRALSAVLLVCRRNSQYGVILGGAARDPCTAG